MKKIENETNINEPEIINKKEENDIDEEGLEESKPEKKFNKKLLFIFIPILVLAIVFYIIHSKTEIISNIFVSENDKIAQITNVTYKGKDKYQIESTSTFLVESKFIDEDDLNKYLAIEPAYNYTVKSVGRGKHEITIDNIEANKIVKIDFVKNEKINRKWSFQSNNDYKISSTYPANKKNDISVNSGIDITFTKPGISLDDIEKHFSIEPNVPGEFSVYGRTITFKPNEKLNRETNYIVTITKGLKNNDEEIKEDYSFSFTTEGRDEYNIYGFENNSITLDNISTFKTNEFPKIAIDYYGNEDGEYDEEFDETPYKAVDKIIVEKFHTANDFEKYIKGTTTIDKENLGEYKFHKYNKNTIELNNQLKEGYYLFNLYNGKQIIIKVPVQINDLSAYLMNSERDIIVWAAKNGKFANNIEVSYDNKKEKTNSEGLAIIKNISDGSSKIKYVKINSDKTNPIFVGIENYDLNNYPYGYIYTDRPLYKNTDEVKIWGYVPLKFFSDEVDKNKFSIIFNEKNIPINLTDDGNFETSIKLKNIASDYYDITLNYNNTQIAYREITIENYQLQNYIYEISTDKEYVEAGKKLNVTIKVKHVSNVLASNKDISISFCGKNYKGKTNQSGEVSFSVTAIANKDYGYGYNTKNEYIELLGTAQDSEEMNLYYEVDVIYNKVAFYDSYYNRKTHTYTSKIHNLDLTKKLKPELYIKDSLKGKAYNGKARLVLQEEKLYKSQETEYNEYTNENETYYYWYTEYTKNVLTNNIDVKDGNLNYELNYKFKENTDSVFYEYRLYVYVEDSNNHEIRDVIYVNNYLFNDYEDEISLGQNEIEAIIDGGDTYDLYEYEMNTIKDSYYIKEYSIGDKIIMELLDKSGMPVINNNKVLRIKYKEKILSNSISETNNMDFTFEKNDVPGVEITGAYYDGDNFYRMPSSYYYYKQEDSKISIDIKPTKNNYSPKDEVEIKVSTTDKNGKPIKSNLNISVVNESVFNLDQDQIDILDSIYEYRSYNYYTFSTYRNYALVPAGLGGGGYDDKVRGQFVDTIYFNSVTTDSKGVATIKFKLNDLITSFRITVHASTKDGDVGSNYTKISSTLPLAIESLAPAFVKSSDDLVINATSLSQNNKKGKVKYTFEIKEINKKIEKNDIPGQSVYANFGKLKVGKYTVRITAVQGNLKDIVEYPIEIIETANEIKIKVENNIKNVQSIKPTKNPIYVEIYPNYLSKYLNYLSKMKVYTERLDTKIAYYKSLEYENDFYNTDNNISIEDFNDYKEENELKPLLNADTDEVLTALSLYYTNYFDINSEHYYEIMNSENRDLSVIKSMLVLSAMNEPVLLDLNNYRALTVEENIYKTLAYLFLGDYENAEKIFKENIDKLSVSEDLNSLIAIIETFIDRDKAESTINSILDNKESDKYIRFAIISYFENNQDDLLSNEKVTVYHDNQKEEVLVNKYDIKTLVLYDDSLKDIKFESNSDKINVSYSYVGKISELGEKVVKNISISVSGKNKIGDTLYLNIDLSKSKIGHNNIYVYLPNNVLLSPDSSKVKNVDIMKLLENKVLVMLNPNSPKKISIPLIVKLPGKYTFESVFMEDENEKYYISNEVVFKTN